MYLQFSNTGFRMVPLKYYYRVILPLHYLVNRYKEGYENWKLNQVFLKPGFSHIGISLLVNGL